MPADRKRQEIGIATLPPLPLDDRRWAVLVKTLQLAPQQEKVVELILRGMQDKQIAAALGIGMPTLRTYVQRTFLRLRVDDRMELVLKLFAASLALFAPGDVSLPVMTSCQMSSK